MIQEIQFLSTNSVVGQTVDMSSIPSTSVRMAIAVIGILPIAIVYPLYRKILPKGLPLAR